MREILFRGKSVKKDVWVYGYLICSDGKAWIADNYYGIHYEVIPETVGQFSGLNDKNEKKIFEGDIVEGTFVEEHKIRGEVVYDQDRFIVKGPGSPLSTFARPSQIEVIGNIHANSELLA